MTVSAEHRIHDTGTAVNQQMTQSLSGRPEKAPPLRDGAFNQNGFSVVPVSAGGSAATCSGSDGSACKTATMS